MCNPEDIEAQIDTEQAAALGYDSSVLFYLAYVSQNFGGPLIGLSESDDEIQQAIMDYAADVMSLSYGGAELGLTSYFLDANNTYSSSGFGPTEFAALAAEGIATFVNLRRQCMERSGRHVAWPGHRSPVAASLSSISSRRFEALKGQLMPDRLPVIGRPAD